MWEDSSSHAWTKKEEIADLVADKVRSDLGIAGEGSSRSYDEGGMENDGEDHDIVSKSRKLEKRGIHKQRQRANFSAKIESYEDLEARMEHMKSLVRGHFDEDPARAMTRAEWEAIAEHSAKKAADAQELLRLKKNEEDALRAKAIAAQPPTPQLKITAHVAPESPIEDVFRALANGDQETEAPPDVPAEVARYIRELLTKANETKILKSATFTVTPDINAICQRMANEVHRDVLPGDSHVTATESIKDEFGLRTSATTPPGLLKVMFLAIDQASRSARVQRRLLGLGTVPAQQRPRKR